MKAFNTDIKSVSLGLLILGMLGIQSCNMKTDKKTKNNFNAIENETHNYVQIATGQISLYDEDGNVISKLKPSDSLFGQDANYQKGKKMAFQINEDGTTKDLNSGLVW